MFRAKSAEFVRFERREGTLQGVERNALANAGERQMRRVLAIFLRDADRMRRVFGGVRQRFESGTRVDAGPQDAGMTMVGEPADAANGDFDGAGAGGGRQCSLHFVELLFRPFPNELGSDVEIVDSGPADSGERLQLREQRFQILADSRGNIDGGEQSHRELFSLREGVVILIAQVLFMRKLLVIAGVCAFSLWAADFWTSKPFTDWDQKEVQKIIDNSPWAKQFNIVVSGGGGGSSSGGRREKGGGSMGETDSGGGGGGGNPGGSRYPSAQSDTGGATSISYLIRWQSALPIKQAMVKAKYGAEAATAP